MIANTARVNSIIIGICFLLLMQVKVFSGSISRTQFPVLNNGVTDSSLVNTGGLALGVKNYDNVKLFGDSIPDISINTISSEVLQNHDTLLFFYADTTYKAIFSRKYSLVENGILPLGGWVKFCDADVPLECYVHADNGNRGNLVSFIRKGVGIKKHLRVNNGTSFLDIDSSNSSGWLFSAQCYMENDTFLVAYSSDLTNVKVCKLYSNGSVLQKVSVNTVATGTAAVGKSLMNCSVAYDGQGTILVSWNKGTPKGAKYLQYRFLNRNLDAGPSDSIDQVVSDTNFYYFDNAALAVTAPQKFAVFFWDISGLYLSRINLNGGTIEKTTGIIASGNFRFCSASSNEKYLLAVCKGDLNGDGVAGIEGIRYPIAGGSFGVAEKFIYSDPGHAISTLDQYSTAINCSVDTAGTMGVTWKHQTDLQGAVLAYRGIHHRSGFWTSPVESLSVNYQDSIRFYPSDITVSSLSSWYVEDSMRIGCTVQQCQTAQWIPFTNASLLDSKRSTCRYFQYRLKINRKTGAKVDSLSTPVLSAITIPWNVRPVITTLDSVSFRNRTRTGITFGNSLSVLSRIDTVSAFVKIRDQDSGDLISCKASWPAPNSVASFSSPGFEVSMPALTLFPLPSDTAVTCSLSVWDFKGWTGQTKTLTLIARNALPQLTTKLWISRKMDTVSLVNDSVLLMQENDSISFIYAVSDTNDPSLVKGFISRKTGLVQNILDSTQSSGSFRIRCDTIKPVDSLRLFISAQDPDTVIHRRVTLVVNHAPKITSIRYGSQMVSNNDTIKVDIGAPATIYVNVHDTDLIFWDSLLCKISSRKINDSVISTAANIPYTFIPSVVDSQINFVVIDKSGKRDSLRIYLKSPWLAIDSIANAHFWNARDTLLRLISLIDGSDVPDTVSVPFLNTGIDTMSITDCYIKGKNNRWLSLIVNNDTVTSIQKFSSGPILLQPGIPVSVRFLISAHLLNGDSITSDTAVFVTDDPLHDTVSIPVRLEHNDLPVIIDIKPDFVADITYWKLNKSSSIPLYTFPPHASIKISFSEPIDSVSVLSGLKLYSVFDFMKTGVIEPVNVKYTWTQNYTKLDLSADYLKVSPYFGFQPPAGLFIPTDSLALLLSNIISDRAITPSGPNGLDVHRNFRKIANTDTTIQLRVDSITFTLIGISPVQGDTQVVSSKPEIKLTFSTPIYAASVDTAKVNNKSLIIRSKYNNNQQLAFDSVVINSNNVVFRIARKLFYNDSLFCLYRSASIRNLSGFSIDMNKNGIPGADFDTSSTEDNIEWNYRVKSNRVVSVSPKKAAAVNQISPAVVITFSEPVWSGTFDIDTSAANRSMKIGSMYSSKLSSYSSIRFSPDSLQITLQPATKYFSSDSISCHFIGLSSTYNYNLSNNLPLDSIRTFASTNWYFLTENVGFYTFPNPYKPGKDPRHCSATGSCGIWFKNLHVLKSGINDVVIRIFDMNANPVFDSRKKNVTIHFEIAGIYNAPEWLWDTRNMYNELVASGLYMYCIYDVNGSVLLKDKLIIVR
jgi:hypothetical protein